MARQIKIRLFGGINLKVDDNEIIGFVSSKAEALFVLLAHTQQPQRREYLAEMLWPGRSQKQSAANLRVLLSNLRKVVPEFVNISRNFVAFNLDADYWLDTRTFLEQFSPQSDGGSFRKQWEALQLYRGRFLEGYQLRDGQGFHTWLIEEQTQIHRLVLQRSEQFIDHLQKQGRHDDVLSWTGRLLHIDPLYERFYRQAMQSYAYLGQYDDVQATYARCQKVLAEQLGVEPDQETITVAERLAAARTRAAPRLPRHHTTFVGRDTELNTIAERLANPNCQLVSLVGVGGAGKTRLAIEAAAQLYARYRESATFVSLAEIPSSDMLPVTVASALGMELHGNETSITQLLTFLKEKETLLILDNFEHLQPDGLGFLQMIMDAAPDVQLLVTTRQRLGLPGEWLVETRGLSATGTPDEISDAATLFVTCAQRSVTSFSYTEALRNDVETVCALVDGLPLGIELAAALVRTLTVAEIANEIAVGADVPAMTPLGRPERHRSLLAVFEYSWRLLSPDEKTALKKMAVFRGGFTRHAAAVVAGATFSTLSALIDKSLLIRAVETGRYTMLEVLKQHVLTKWLGQDDEMVELLKLHADYYADFAAGLKQGWSMTASPNRLLPLETDLQNILLAWRTALVNMPLLLEQLMDGLYGLYLVRSWFAEGIELFAEASELLEGSAEPHLLRASLNVRRASLLGHLGEFEQARELFMQQFAVIESQSSPGELAFTLRRLSLINYRLADYVLARSQAERSLEIGQALGDDMGIASALRTLGTIARDSGQYERAAEYFHESLARYRATPDELGMALTLNTLANNYCEYGDWEAAVPMFEEALEIFRESGWRFYIAMVLNNLATVDVGEGNFDLGLARLQETRSICEEIGDQAGVAIAVMNMGVAEQRRGNPFIAKQQLQTGATALARLNYPYMQSIALTHLGHALFDLEEYADARRIWRASIRIANDCNALSMVVHAIAGIAKSEVQLGRYIRAGALAHFAIASELANKEGRDYAEQVVDMLDGRLDEAEWAEARLQATSFELTDLVNDFLTD